MDLRRRVIFVLYGSFQCPYLIRLIEYHIRNGTLARRNKMRHRSDTYRRCQVTVTVVFCFDTFQKCFLLLLLIGLHTQCHRLILACDHRRCMVFQHLGLHSISGKYDTGCHKYQAYCYFQSPHNSSPLLLI